MAGRPKGAKNKAPIKAQAKTKATTKTTPKVIAKAAPKATKPITAEPKLSAGVQVNKNPAQNPYRTTGVNAFNAGNPGRPLGSKNRKTTFLEALTEDTAKEVLDKFILMTKKGRDKVEGDVECILFAMDRLYPRTGNQHYVKLDLHKHDLHTIGGLNDAAKHVLHETSEGELSIEEAQILLNALKDKRDFNLHEIDEEVKVFRKNKEGR